MLSAKSAHRFIFYATFGPLLLSSGFKIVFVIFKQFLQTRFCHINGLISVLEEVEAAEHPSTIFCLPLLAA